MAGTVELPMEALRFLAKLMQTNVHVVAATWDPNKPQRERFTAREAVSWLVAHLRERDNTQLATDYFMLSKEQMLEEDQKQMEAEAEAVGLCQQLLDKGLIGNMSSKKISELLGSHILPVDKIEKTS